MDYFNPDRTSLLPFQATPTTLGFQADDGGTGLLPSGTATARSAADQGAYNDAFLLQDEMLQDAGWPDEHALESAWSLENPETMAWSLSSVSLAYTTSNGDQSTESSGNVPSSPSQVKLHPSKRNKVEERRERRRMQNRAAQRHFRDRRKVELRDNVDRVQRMESEIKELSGEKEKMEDMVKALRGRCAGLETERQSLKREQRMLDGEMDGDGAGVAAEAAEEIEKLVKGVMGEDARAKEEEGCRWHWMKVKRRKAEEKRDWTTIPSIFL